MDTTGSPADTRRSTRPDRTTTPGRCCGIRRMARPSMDAVESAGPCARSGRVRTRPPAVVGTVLTYLHTVRLINEPFHAIWAMPTAGPGSRVGGTLTAH